MSTWEHVLVQYQQVLYLQLLSCETQYRLTMCVRAILPMRMYIVCYLYERPTTKVEQHAYDSIADKSHVCLFLSCPARLASRYNRTPSTCLPDRPT